VIVAREGRVRRLRSGLPIGGGVVGRAANRGATPLYGDWREREDESTSERACARGGGGWLGGNGARVHGARKDAGVEGGGGSSYQRCAGAREVPAAARWSELRIIRAPRPLLALRGAVPGRGLRRAVIGA